MKTTALAPAFVLVLLLALVASACTGSDEPVSIATSTSSPPASPTATQPPATATAPPALTSTPEAATPTPEASTATPGPTPAPVAPPDAPEARDGDATGVPFSTVDLRVAVEDGRGYSWWLLEDRDPVCPNAAVPGRPYWSANLAGSDFGPVFVLWVYPDAAALQADWDVEPGERPAPRFDCDLPSGFVYWNNNLVLAFDVWLSLGEEVTHNESPTDMPAVQAFLELTPP